jgi:type III secretion system FlhB-like substrate exporter
MKIQNLENFRDSQNIINKNCKLTQTFINLDVDLIVPSKMYNSKYFIFYHFLRISFLIKGLCYQKT